MGLGVQADVGYQSLGVTLTAGKGGIAFTRHQQRERYARPDAGYRAQTLLTGLQRGMPLYLLGDRPLQVSQFILQRLEQAFQARAHGRRGIGPHPQLLVPSAFALQPVVHFIAPTKQLLQLTHLAGEGLPDRQGGLCARAKACEQQRVLPIGFSAQALAPRPRPHARCARACGGEGSLLARCIVLHDGTMGVELDEHIHEIPDVLATLWTLQVVIQAHPISWTIPR